MKIYSTLHDDHHQPPPSGPTGAAHLRLCCCHLVPTITGQSYREEREKERDKDKGMAEKEMERDLAFMTTITNHRRLVPPVLPISDCAATTQFRPSPVRAIEKRERWRETEIQHGGETQRQSCERNCIKT
jgi:hypothetical protein